MSSPSFGCLRTYGRTVLGDKDPGVATGDTEGVHFDGTEGGDVFVPVSSMSKVLVTNAAVIIHLNTKIDGDKRVTFMAENFKEAKKAMVADAAKVMNDNGRLGRLDSALDPEAWANYFAAHNVKCKVRDSA